MAVSFLSDRNRAGRSFLLDPVVGGDREEELRFLQELVLPGGAGRINVYLLQRLRQRARGGGASARVARELHDGAVQSPLPWRCRWTWCAAPVSHRSPVPSQQSRDGFRVVGAKKC